MPGAGRVKVTLRTGNCPGLRPRWHERRGLVLADSALLPLVEVSCPDYLMGFGVGTYESPW
jgi:hypothetical protein